MSSEFLWNFHKPAQYIFCFARGNPKRCFVCAARHGPPQRSAHVNSCMNTSHHTHCAAYVITSHLCAALDDHALLRCLIRRHNNELILFPLHAPHCPPVPSIILICDEVHCAVLIDACVVNVLTRAVSCSFSEMAAPLIMLAALLAASVCRADMYLHNMRGSNNRLKEANRDRDNANRCGVHLYVWRKLTERVHLQSLRLPEQQPRRIQRRTPVFLRRRGHPS